MATKSADGSGAAKVKRVFVISPIGTLGSDQHRHASLVLNYVIRKALPKPAWEVVRADEDSSPDSISAQVIKQIVEADVVVAVLTDRNANVFYELAVAHGYSKPVISLLQEGQTLPFDVIDQRAISYDLTNPASVDQAIADVQSAAAWLEEHSGSVARNPLSSFDSFERIAAGDDAGTGDEAVAEVLASVLEGLSDVARRLSRLEHRTNGFVETPLPASRTDSTTSEAFRGRRVQIRRRLASLEKVLETMAGDASSDDRARLDVLRERDALKAELAELSEAIKLL